MVQKFRETAENHTNVNFRDKNFVIAPIFRDSCSSRPPFQNFCEENFRDPKSNHENIVPQKFGAIRQLQFSWLLCLRKPASFLGSPAFCTYLLILIDVLLHAQQ